MNPQKRPDVIIVGAGPTGLFTACLLIELGLRVIVLERDTVLHPAIRALGYYGPTQYALRKAGIFEEVRDRGFFQLSFSWRKITKQIAPDEKVWGDLVAAWNPWEDSTLQPGECGYGMLCMGQDQLREICLAKLKKSDRAQVLLGYSVMGLTQEEQSATLDVIDPTGTQIQFTAPFVIGADGGKSAVRKLIGQILDGYTWSDTLVATDIECDIVPPENEPPLVYILDPQNIAFFSPIKRLQNNGPNLYRFTFAMPTEHCLPDVFDHYVAEKIELLFPGKRPLKYKILNAQSYRIHQRQVASYMVGRTLLIGDAAHLNTPWGGLGLTTGLLDADALSDAMDLVFNEGKPAESVLKAWADARHAVWKNVVDPISTGNQLRCQRTDPENPKGDEFLRMLIEKHEQELKVINHTFDKEMITRMREIVV